MSELAVSGVKSRCSS